MTDGAICCICFEWVPIDECWVDESGQKWDMCKRCGDAQASAEAAPFYRGCDCSLREFFADDGDPVCGCPFDRKDTP